MSIALITGLEFEANVARKVCKELSTDTIVSVAGIGAPFAEQVVSDAQKAGAKGIVSFGVCGGLDPALPTGRVILPEKVLGSDEIAVDAVWRQGLQNLLADQFDITSQPLVTVEKPVESTIEKTKLFQRTRACAVDMESAILAREAAKHNLPFIVVRVIHDPAAQAIPAAFSDIMRANGQIDPWKLVKGLMFNWPGFAELKKMSNNDAQARTNLEGLTRLALPAFGRIDRNLNR